MRFAPSLYHLLQSIVIASVSVALSLPTVTLDNATVVGAPVDNLALYLGIPFARPPIGPLRLNLPLPVAPYTGTINATVSGNQCIQKPEILPTLPANVPMAVEQFLQTITSVPNTPQSEDCTHFSPSLMSLKLFLAFLLQASTSTLSPPQTQSPETIFLLPW